MREPKGSGFVVLLLATAVAVSGAPLQTKQEEPLPHSRDYYDGYVRALVDHYDEIFRSQRAVTADKQEDAAKKNTVSSDVGENAAKRDETQSESAAGKTAAGETATGETATGETASGEAPVNTTSGGQDNSTVSDRPYINPEQTGKPPVTDTEKEEAPTPDAHKKNEQDQGAKAETIDTSYIQKSMFKPDGATSVPESMEDIKFYTGKPREFEDMKRKRSTEGDSPLPMDTKALQPVVTEAASVVAERSSVASPSPAAEPVAVSSKHNDMTSESKITSHSASTYTPGDPFKNPPQNPPNSPPDPNKEEPYKKNSEQKGAGQNKEAAAKKEEDSRKNPKVAEKQQEEKAEEESAESEDDAKENAEENESEAAKQFNGKPKKEEDNESESEAGKEFNGRPEKEEDNESESEAGKEFNGKPEKEEDNESESEAGKEFNGRPEKEEDNESESEAGKEFNGKPEKEEEEDEDQEFSGAPGQAFIPMLLVPVNAEGGEDYGSAFGADGGRKDRLGSKREGDKKDDKKKDDDDDDDEHDDHAYLAPLWGYPGWYEAGHGIPYGYGTNMLSGHHSYGHHGYGYPLFGHHESGHHGYGHHGSGHHGSGHHGFGHHGYGHHGHMGHGSLHLDNGVIWPNDGGYNFFYSPCGCSSGAGRGLGFGRSLAMF